MGVPPSDDSGADLRRPDSMLKELGDETIALKNEVDSLRALAAQLTSEYHAIIRIACEARERSVAVANKVGAIEERMPPLTVQEQLARQVDERFDALNTLMHDVTVRTQTVQAHKDAIDGALREAGRLADMVRRMEERVAKLRDGEQLITQKEASHQIETAVLETIPQVEREEQLSDEARSQPAGLERPVRTRIGSSRSDGDDSSTEKKPLSIDMPLAAHNALFGAAAMNGELPHRRISRGRFVAGAVAATLLVGVISFFVTDALVRRARVGNDRLPPSTTSVTLPSHDLTSVPPTDPPSTGSEQALDVSPPVEPRRDAKGTDRMGPSAQPAERSASKPSLGGTGTLMGTLPDATPRENTSGELNANPTPPRDDVSGWWMLTSQIEQSRVNSFNKLALGFRVRLDQAGNRVRGSGFKWLENGRPVAVRNRTPITVDGRIEGSRLALSFTERGVRRTSRGTFEMELADDGSLRGRFRSEAGGSSGWAQALRMSSPPK
jgi:hypothetical protein